MSVHRNTVWNLVGTGFPILVAIVAIPPLINQLGGDRFGVLAIGWVITAYFVLSDFGVGIATKRHLSNVDKHMEAGLSGSLIWTSLLAHAVLGLLSGAIFALLIPLLINNVFTVPPSLQTEAAAAFHWLAASIPVLLITSCLRNIFEARHRFDITNILRVPAGAINYLVPLLSLHFSRDISQMLAAIFIGRVVVLIAHMLYAHRAVPELSQSFAFSMSDLRKLIGFGLWATLSSLINPVAMIADRFFVASIFSLAAVTYYITPYEMVTKLWILSASLLGALFPVLSATEPRSAEMARIVRSAFVVLIAMSVPAVAFILVFSRDILGVWISADVALQSGSVAKWIAVGVFFNIMAQIPFTVLQATGRPEIVAKVQLVQLPFFLLLAWGLSRWQGTVGVAMAWALRTLVEGLILQFVTARWTGIQGQRFNFFAQGQWRLFPIFVFLVGSWIIESVWRTHPLPRIIGFVILLSLFLWWLWQKLLSTEERVEFSGRFRLMFRRGQ